MMDTDPDIVALKAHLARCKGLLESALVYVKRGAQTPTPYHEADYNAIELTKQIEAYQQEFRPNGRKSRQNLRR